MVLWVMAQEFNYRFQKISPLISMLNPRILSKPRPYEQHIITQIFVAPDARNQPPPPFSPTRVIFKLEDYPFQLSTYTPHI
jgi:hypothetical protein